jgi:hypothetical protein
MKYFFRVLIILLVVCVLFIPIYYFAGLKDYINLVKIYKGVKKNYPNSENINLENKDFFVDGETIHSYIGIWSKGNLLVWGNKGPQYFLITTDTEYNKVDPCDITTKPSSFSSFNEMMKGIRDGSQVQVHYTGSLIKKAVGIISYGNSKIFGTGNGSIYCN